MDGQHKSYRAWDAESGGTTAVSPREVLPEGDLVFFLLDAIGQLDLLAFHKHYAGSLRGQPPFDVAMMVTLLVYSYCVGVCSSRKIAAACERNLAFRAIVGDDPPDFRTIGDFRKIHQEAFAALFVEVLRLAGEAGLVKLGNLSTDGTKIKANASRHKAMSFGHMEKEIARLNAEVAQLLAEAERIDAEQDAALGSRRGDELPAELSRRTDRLAKIHAAKARLEEQAAARAAEKERLRAEVQAQRQQEDQKPRGRPAKPVDPTPEDKAQTNFTDPEAKIMKQNNKGFDYSFNAQAVVDGEAQIIVAAEVTDQANDKRQAAPMARAALANLTAADIPLPVGTDGQPAPIPNTADAGYFSEEAVAELESLGFDPYLATGRQKHHEAPPPTVEGAAPDTATAKQKMAHKLRTAAGKALYKARKHIVEPVFGQIKQVRGIRSFLRRGIRAVGGEWKLICLSHNFLKIWRHTAAASA